MVNIGHLFPEEIGGALDLRVWTTPRFASVVGIQASVPRKRWQRQEFQRTSFDSQLILNRICMVTQHNCSGGERAVKGRNVQD